MKLYCAARELKPKLLKHGIKESKSSLYFPPLLVFTLV